MNAQQQLAELNARQCKTLTDEADLRHDRARWIRDHGHAIAELIEAVSARRAAESAWLDYEIYGENPVPYDPKESVRLENVRDAAIDRETAALSRIKGE